MEVASPIPFAPSGSKRAFAAYPTQMMDSSCGNSMEDCDMIQQRSTKRRRFIGDNTAESTPLHTNYYNNQNVVFSPSTNGQQLKRRAASPASDQLNRVVEEQSAVIESLKSEKKEVQSSFETLKTEHDRTAKENHILRKAVHIQQDRQNHAENELKNAQKYREGAEEQIRKMEQMILSLRYHLQAQQSSRANDFMGMPPPNVF
mmetsp:Transcript_1383/g.1864  ORF Transcript_1383/g.1864 Transcript_1383/m.1864 type:complete len:203 (+) Transcript_1383:94-702(+)|eukprot:CAMPEP_0198139698 /NCGR_PEP_ID=MMETSP1443-20131203/2961_1 /TAXON_ID=186043 /ORGANISM="Entomoneis sp., Strain CCMP2396" /LENGTH=202 /DNA_ID=CAMNT_0043801899 /DNA_START=22 /DNA_END=630 /DNA_ORIENTATION=+